MRTPTRRHLPLALAVTALVLGGCGDDAAPAGVASVPPPAGHQRGEGTYILAADDRAQVRADPRVAVTTVGSGPTGATILRPKDRTGPLPVVIFIHGWRAVSLDYYRPWLDHLALEGNVVIHPTYQTIGVTTPNDTLPNALAGIRAALPRAGARPGTLVVVGHSVGGALAADYAASARAAGLPVPLAAVSIFPGRKLGGERFLVPAVNRALIPPSVDLVVMAGAADRVVGTRWAREIYRDAVNVPASRKQFILVDDPEADDHLAPQRDAPASRAIFWGELDRVMARVRATAAG